ncbi:hypothetical protein [Mesorhizobium tamadayense]|uniref:hypothetical protein n=1 Tax=Mesorhizobium tamadayense TaxID=425306 RepID=UPI001FE19B25|nr:hypothetical protein [Mesorhizobium tamadayense]
MDSLLADLGPEEFLVNEIIEIDIENGVAVATRYDLPLPGIETRLEVECGFFDWADADISVLSSLLVGAPTSRQRRSYLLSFN